MRGLLSLVAAFIAAVPLSLGSAKADPAPERPRLAVLVVVDHLRSVEIERYADLFGPGGFGGLMDRGAAWFDAEFRHITCETAPGHATLLTGASPSIHGIVGNQWYTGGEPAYCVGQADAAVLGNAEARGIGPANLAVGTLGDAMKADTGGVSKVAAVSLKDRGAILSGGHSADLAVWYDRDLGHFTTSTAYTDSLPPWASGAEAAKRSVAEGTWSPLEVPARWAPRISADAHANEAHAYGWTDRFPHDLASLDEPGRRRAYPASPSGMADQFALALEAMARLELGQDGEPDLLVVSVSTPDYVAHIFGPLSLEFMDILRRTDAELRAFTAALDERLGKGGYVLALTGDHGGTPLVERVAATGLPVQRVDKESVETAAEKALTAALGSPPGGGAWVQGFAVPHLYLRTDLAPEAARPAALEAARRAIEAVPGIARATVLDAPVTPLADPYLPTIQAVAFPGRAGQIVVRQDPRVVYRYHGSNTGTDHGTPYVHDRRVPLLVYGPGVRGGRYAQPVDARDVAPTLAFLLGVSPPDACQGVAVPAVGAQ
jgi:predicted AlkP superfamily pyrophosphatase or phosphodiesterase